MVSHGGEAVEFEIEIRGKRLPCSVAREALEDHFWQGKRTTLASFAPSRMAESGLLRWPNARLVDCRPRRLH
jgi:Protein of unknown function (DUF1488)